jgi:hypothetical protein
MVRFLVAVRAEEVALGELGPELGERANDRDLLELGGTVSVVPLEEAGAIAEDSVWSQAGLAAITSTPALGGFNRLALVSAVGIVLGDLLGRAARPPSLLGPH